MNIATKILTSFITLTFAVIGGIYTATTVLLHTMDAKDAAAKVEIRQEMDLRKAARDTQLAELKEHLDQRFKDNQTYIGNRMDAIEKLVKNNR